MPLPPGFVLEQPQTNLTQSVRLPPGFVLEGQGQIQDLNPTGETLNISRKEQPLQDLGFSGLLQLGLEHTMAPFFRSLDPTGLGASGIRSLATLRPEYTQFTPEEPIIPQDSRLSRAVSEVAVGPVINKLESVLGAPGVLERFLDRMISGSSTPGMLGTLPTAAVSKPAQAMFLAQTVPGVYESGKKVLNKSLPTKERQDATLDAIANTVFSVLLGKGLVKGTPMPEAPPTTPKPEVVPPERRLNLPGFSSAVAQQEVEANQRREAGIRQSQKTVAESAQLQPSPTIQLPQGFVLEPYPPSRQIEAPGVGEARYKAQVEEQQRREAELREQQGMFKQEQKTPVSPERSRMLPTTRLPPPIGQVRELGRPIQGGPQDVPELEMEYQKAFSPRAKILGEREAINDAISDRELVKLYHDVTDFRSGKKPVPQFNKERFFDDLKDIVKTTDRTSTGVDGRLANYIRQNHPDLLHQFHLTDVYTEGREAGESGKLAFAYDKLKIMGVLEGTRDPLSNPKEWAGIREHVRAENPGLASWIEQRIFTPEQIKDLDPFQEEAPQAQGTQSARQVNRPSEAAKFKAPSGGLQLKRQPQGFQLKPTEEQIRKQQQEGAINLQGPLDVLKEFKAKVMDGTQILNRLRNKLHPDEWKMYDDAGIVAAFANKKVDPKDVATWMQDNGPRVEVRKFGGGEVAEATRRVRELQHTFYDALTPEMQGEYDKAAYKPEPSGMGTLSDTLNDGFLRERGWGEGSIKKAKEYHAASIEAPMTEDLGDASHWSSIAPKSEQDMPGYTEGAVVARPLLKEQFHPENWKKAVETGYAKEGQLGDAEMFPSTHSFPPNTLAFWRGYMETLPNGKKIFHVIEVQSDWAQRVRDVERTRGNIGDPDFQNHPLLRQYERLALKSAIEHAKAEGADAIAVSDAETAMMTEGHDLIVRRAFVPVDESKVVSQVESQYPDLARAFDIIPASRSEIRPQSNELGFVIDRDTGEHVGKIEVDKRNESPVITMRDFPLMEKYFKSTPYKIEGGRKGGFHVELKDREVKGLEYKEITTSPNQEPGMRLHYDRTLPGILEELTGQKGERVVFGEHKMAVDQGERITTNVAKDLSSEEASALAEKLTKETGKEHKTYYQEENDKYEVNRFENAPRKNLIFREPTGEPKTSVTAKMFPLDKVASTDFTAFGKDRPTTSEAAKFRAPSGGLQLKPTEEQQRLRSQEGGGFGYRTYRKDIEKGQYRPSNLPSTQKESKGDRAKAILSNPTAKPLETRPEYRAQPGEKTSLLTAFVNRITEAQNTAGKVDKLLLPIDVIVDDLDGGQAKYTGTLMQQVRWPLDDDFNEELQRRDKYTDSVVKLVKDAKLNKQNGERIGVYAIAQQEGGVQRLIDSGVSQGTINKILGSMTSKELDVYREMRKQMDATLPEVQKLAKELYGTDVKPVKNYFPFKRDWEIFQPEADEIAGPKVGKESTPDIVAWRELAQDYGERSTKAEQGFTKERKPNAKTGIKVNAFEIYDRHMRDVAHFLAMQKNLKEVGEIVRGDEFKEKYGDRGQQLMVDWLNTVAKQGRYKRNAVLDTIRRNIAKGIIAFRIPSQIVHLANVPLAQERAGLVWHNRGMEASLSDEGQAFLHKYFGETFERGGGEEALQEASRGPITRAGFYIQRELDRLNSQATVLGVYMKRLQEKGLDPQDYDTLPVDKDAVREARVLARRAVASPLYKDVPLALTKGGSGAKFFFQFQNTFLDQWSNIRYDLIQAGLGKNFVNNPKLAARMTLAIGMMLLVESGVKYGAKQAINKATGRKQREDDTFAGTLLHEATRRVPGMGQALSAIQYGETGVPGADVVLEAAKATKQAVKAESPKERLLAGARAATAVGELAGVPGVSQVSDIAQAKMKSEMFKTHQQRLEEVGGKPLNKMTIDERHDAEKELKKERGPQSRSDSAKGAATAIKNNEKRGEELQTSLDPKVQKWLDEKNLRIPGYTDAVPYRKEELVLTKGEQARYKVILTEKYNKFLLPWINSTPTKQSFSMRLEQAHNQAKTQLLNEIRSNSISESDEKPKKKRFSFMGE